MAPQPPNDTFTRFTSTTPHAVQSQSHSSFNSRTAQNASTTGQQPPNLGSGPEGETPAQKVARLRVAARQARERGQLSTADRIIARGRFWADFAHRATTYGLLAITGVSSVVAAYGLVSLVSHNRRQKRAWIEREMDRLDQARQAFLRGEANAEQLHLLEQERAGEEIAKKYKEDKEKRKAEGVFGRIKGTFGTFMGQGDKGIETSKTAQAVTDIQSERSVAGERLLNQGWVDGETAFKPVAVQESNIPGVGLDEKGRPVPINKVERIGRKIQEERRSGENEVIARTGISGGPLDVLAGNVAGAITPQGQNSQSWWSWISSSNKSS